MKGWLKLWEWRLSLGFGLVIGLALLMMSPVRAAALSQGFASVETLTPGALVGLDPTSLNTVRSSNTDRLGELIGVVVSSDSTLLAVSGAGNNVQVVTNGSAGALVSTLNGDIKKGDPITASPIAGVGMKATAPGRILGLAQDDFSTSSASATSKSVNTKSGQQQVSIGSVPVLIAVGYYTPKGNIVPPALQTISNFIAGKQVSAWRIITASLILIIGIVLAVIILNGAVKSSLNSIGRNPLARGAVSSGLFKVILISLAILLTTIGSVYFVIKG